MEEEASEHAPRETGGMLLGYRSADGDPVVTALVEGGPKAIRKRSRFVPDGEWQERRLAEIYSRSGFITTFLGDWHSHPKGYLRPSLRDRETARKVARSREARAPHPLTVICAGSEEDGWRWGAFQFQRRHGFDELKLNAYVLSQGIDGSVFTTP